MYRLSLHTSIRRSVVAATLRSQSTTATEDVMKSILLNELDATAVTVKDTSGGCGAMFEISCESPQFVGKRMVAQHRMVNEALKEQIAEIHGLTITTKASPVVE